MNAARAIYSAFYIVGLAVSLPFWLHRIHRKREWHLIADRLALRAWPAGRPDIWIHAVSVGEARGAVALIEELRRRSPALAIFISVTTRTAYQTVSDWVGLQPPGITGPFIAPLDLPWAVRRRLDQVCPRMLVILETELWPNLIGEARARGIRLALANARISDRSFPRYRAVRRFFSGVLDSFDRIFAQSGLDAARLRAIGAPPDRIIDSGNLKVDAIRLNGESPFPARPVWLAASTHPGEESLVLRAAREMKSRGRRFELILAPRHPERAAEVERLIHEFELPCLLRSAGADAPPEDGVLLLDTIGELPAFIARATVVVMGGSFIPHGGQNPLEPAAAARPILFGPHMNNFRPAAAALWGSGAVRVPDGESLALLAESLLFDADRAKRMGSAARARLESLKGGVARHADGILQLLEMGEHSAVSSQPSA